MIGPLSAQNTAISLLKAGSENLFQTGNKNTAAGQGNSLLALMEELDPRQAEALRKKQQDSQNLIRQLRSSRTDLSEQRKAAAAEKVQRIKQKLQALRLLASVNPKAAARQAAQLSRELAQAAKEYAGAGGGAASAIPLPGANAGGGATATAVAGAEGAIESAALVPQVQTETVVPPESAEVAGTAEAEAPDALNPESIRQSLEEIQKQKEQDEQAFKDGIQAQIGAAGEEQAKSRADSEFAKEVREVKNALKQIIEAAKKKLAEEGDESADQDLKTAENALNEVDQSLAAITSTGTPGAVNIVV